MILSNLFFWQYTFGGNVILGICFTALGILIIYFALKTMEMAYVLRHKKSYYTHFYLRLRKLTNSQKTILINDFTFYSKLKDDKLKSYFEHRVASFIIDKDFIGRSGVSITEEMKVLISATAVMLTFGFRDFYIGILSKIVIYPKAYYSNITKVHHKGEFNPKLKALILSWEDFKEGYRIEDDNFNLGIHEITHAIHFNSFKENDVSSTIFKDSFKSLTNLLTQDLELRERLVKSEYFRGYAYTNQFEFLAVLIENFMETPESFRNAFPQIYAKVKQMLNFEVKGY